MNSFLRSDVENQDWLTVRSSFEAEMAMARRRLIVEESLGTLQKVAGIGGAFAVGIFLWVGLVKLAMRLLGAE